ncbi:Transcriptional regulator, AbiEi antitoxin, Type IV TA system [Nocardioides terrae]|uniref:Transcriptional regulator, AbiEi antitoxin, Type IV TA system n=1 Tax=Nocardioides terrae TaxID=574651 RepID=A0A1I1DWM9_9ACTN|nr:hypothetical protein [Nocardioides terrae]SFB79227.1 Transcriptional regulator, AbiEi antitoxin, Type IV TA system [Nocardioides terrae]
MDPVGLLVQLGGAASTATLLANVSRRELRTSLGRGEIVRVGRGRYALPVVDEALTAAHALDAYLTHLSAALHWGWEVRLPPATPQLAVPRGRQVPEGVRLIDLRREDLDGWATSRLQTVLMCAADLPFPDGLAVADSALRHGELTRLRLERAAVAFPGRRGPLVRRVVAYADPRAANPFESALRALAIGAGLGVVPQFRVRLGGVTLHPDLADPLRGIALEAESWEFHGRDKKAFERDCQRYTLLTAAGWRVLRFTWREVIHDPG